MKILRVIPISRGIAKDELSYFSSNPPEVGSLIFVPLRGRKTPGIIWGVEDLKEQKAKLKSSDFTLRKIEKSRPVKILHPSFVHSASKIAYDSVSSLGAVLHTLVPKVILENPEQIEEIKTETESKKFEKNARISPISEKLILQNNFKERVEQYKGLIRNHFAKGKSVLLLTATIKEAEELHSVLSKGIEEFSFILHSGFSKKEQVAKWNKAVSFKQPIFTTLTGTFLSIPLFNIGAIFVDNTISPYYKTNSRPFIDLREAALEIAKTYRAKIVFSGLTLRISDFWRYKEGEFEALDPPALNIKSNAQTKVIDMRPKEEDESLEARVKNKSKEKDFKILSKELKEIISEAKAKQKNVFVFTSKKGLASTVVCEDCGELVRCKECGAIVSLFKKGRYNSLICRACGAQESALQKCANCNSWKLKDLGIGSQKVYDKIKKEFPEVKVFLLDKENAATHKKAKKMIDEFYSSDNGAILIGTEMALSYLGNIDFSAIASLDSILSIPDFKIEERVFSIISKISIKTLNKFVIQTRIPDSPALVFGSIGDFSSFYQNEIEMRKTLNYPPFSKIIKISCTSTPARLNTLAKKVEEVLLEYTPQRYQPSLTKIPKGKKSINFLIKIKEENWPDEYLIKILKNLPIECGVDTTPENLL